MFFVFVSFLPSPFPHFHPGSFLFPYGKEAAPRPPRGRCGRYHAPKESCVCPSVRMFHRSQAHARAVTHTRPLPTFRFDVVCADDGGGSEDEREAGGAEGGADEGKKGKGRSRCVSAPCLVATCVACAACAVASSRCGRRLKWQVSCHRLLPGCAWIASVPLSCVALTTLCAQNASPHDLPGLAAGSRATGRW